MEGRDHLGRCSLTTCPSTTNPSRTAKGWDYRVRFWDASHDEYTLPVTDLAFRYFVDAERAAGRIAGEGRAGSIAVTLNAATHVFLRIGLTREWPRGTGHCHLQVNGIYSTPDYLEGRSFADFAPADEEEFAF